MLKFSSNENECKPPGLGTVRYCNPQCQKAHWTAHKAHCGGRQAVTCHRCESDRGETGA